MSCNPELSAYITELIGDGWKKDANELEKLGNFINDDAVLTKLVDIKNAKKTELASYLKKTQNLDVPDNSIFDIQVKDFTSTRDSSSMCFTSSASTLRSRQARSIYTNHMLLRCKGSSCIYHCKGYHPCNPLLTADYQQ